MSRHSTQTTAGPKQTPKTIIVEGSIVHSWLVPRKRPARLVTLTATLMLSGFMLITTGRFLLPLTPWFAPRATIVLRSAAVDRNSIVQVTTTVMPRTDTVTSPRLPIRATGLVRIQARAAYGTLTFYNPAGFPQTVATGTVIEQAGWQVVTDMPVTIPSGSPSVAGAASIAAHALQAGTLGNRGPLTINGLCTQCSGTGIAVKNLVSFVGGQDASHYTYVRQVDVDGVKLAQEPLLETRSRADLQAQLHRGEQLGAPIACSQHTVSNPAIGAKAAQAFVQVNVTCSALVYAPLDIQHQAAGLFRSEVEHSLDRHMVLAQPVAARIQSVAQSAPDTLTISVLAAGHWVFHMSATEQATVIRRIAGAAQKEALATLLSIPGVIGATIEGIGSNDQLPSDPAQLTLHII